jgi:uncharacterized protein YegP (UPF0339 family)
MARVEIYKSEHADVWHVQQWRWRVKAGNGEIVAQGEAHGSRADAERAFLTAASVIYTAAESLRARQSG